MGIKTRRAATLAALAGGLILALSAPAFAEWRGGHGHGGGYSGSPWTATPDLDRHQARQDRQVDRGIAEGRIGRREARRIERAQDRLERHEFRAKADGVVTWEERQRLRQQARRVDGLIAESYADGPRRHHRRDW